MRFNNYSSVYFCCIFLQRRRHCLHETHKFVSRGTYEVWGMTSSSCTCRMELVWRQDNEMLIKCLVLLSQIKTHSHTFAWKSGEYNISFADSAFQFQPFSLPLRPSYVLLRSFRRQPTTQISRILRANCQQKYTNTEIEWNRRRERENIRIVFLWTRAER